MIGAAASSQVASVISMTREDYTVSSYYQVQPLIFYYFRKFLKKTYMVKSYLGKFRYFLRINYYGGK